MFLRNLEWAVPQHFPSLDHCKPEMSGCNFFIRAFNEKKSGLQMPRMTFAGHNLEKASPAEAWVES